MPAAETVLNGAYAKLPGVKLWFTDTGGTGTPIVLLHANTGTSASWDSQVVAFAAGRLSRHRLRSSRLGKKLGQSCDRSGSPGSVAADLDALVDPSQARQVPPGGGGGRRLRFARLCRSGRPERLRSLVVAGSNRTI